MTNHSVDRPIGPVAEARGATRRGAGDRAHAAGPARTSGPAERGRG
ncbi:hypothetical protein ACMA1D_05160 [Streptomyces sp. 796.1]